MRRVLFLITLLIFVLVTVSACAAESAPTEVSSDVDEHSTPTHIPVDLTPAQRAAMAALSSSLGLPADNITLVSTEAVDWPDGCLGVAQAGLACTQAIVPGFRVLLEADGREVEYRTNQDGTNVRPATVLMTWKREGGIAGFCDFITVYLSGEVYGSSCKNDQYVEEPLMDVLSDQEIAKLDEWVKDYGSVSIDASDPKGVSDRMVVTLEFMGLGKQETFSSSTRQDLLEFAQSLNQTLYK